MPLGLNFMPAMCNSSSQTETAAAVQDAASETTPVLWESKAVQADRQDVLGAQSNKPTSPSELILNRLTVIDIPDSESRLIADQTENTSLSDGLSFKEGEDSPRQNMLKDESDSMINENIINELESFVERARQTKNTSKFQRYAGKGASGNGSFVNVPEVLQQQTPRAVKFNTDFTELLQPTGRSEEDENRASAMAAQIDSLLHSYKQVVQERDKLKAILKHKSPVSPSHIGNRRNIPVPPTIVVQYFSLIQQLRSRRHHR